MEDKKEKVVPMITIDYDFEAWEMDLKDGGLKFNLMINYLIKDNLDKKETAKLYKHLQEVTNLLSRGMIRQAGKMKEEQKNVN